MQYRQQMRFPPGIRWSVKPATTPGFWLILAAFVLISIPHYDEALKHPAFITDLFSSIGLARHSFERILYLVPIVWSAFLFGRKGAITVSLAALALMLVHTVLLSSTPTDDILEACAVFVMGNVIAFTVASLHSERKRRAQLEMAQEELHTSEARYRGLFENALDAIWIHDFDGNVLAANGSAAELTGYSMENLLKMNVREFLSAESLHLAGTVRYKLLANRPVDQPYEQHLTRKDGSEAIIQLVTGLVRDKGEPAGFQHIARDVTEQKRLQENLLLFSRYSTRAHEEERKRITRKIHEETIQDLAVLCRLLDTLDPSRGLPPAESRSSLDELRQQTSRIMQDLRVLGRELRPSGLDHLGLVPVLQWLARNLGEHAGTGLEVNVIGDPRRLPEEVELVQAGGQIVRDGRGVHGGVAAVP